MLIHERIRSFCQKPISNQFSNGYSDIKDGNVVKLNPFFKEGVLQVILFQDAFEVCNPLGSSKGKFKMVGIYMTLGNLPPYMRSKTDNYKLVALCKFHTFKHLLGMLYLNA